MSDAEDEDVINVQGLSVTFHTREGSIEALRDVSFAISPGESVGVVGESGSGKSLTAAAIMGLLPSNAVAAGSVRFRGHELLGASESSLRDLRGRRMAIVAQDSLTAMNPVHTVGQQIAEAIKVHDSKVSRGELRERSVALLDLVGIPQASARVDNYPHEFSGGMRQRALIAMSVANEPDLIVADEPTTALDVTVQAQILDVLQRIQRRTGTSLMLITHDLGVVAGVADRVLVMYSGKVVEEAGVDAIFYDTAHPYTRGLLASLPRLDSRDRSQPLYRIPGIQPSPSSRPGGCAFHPRCDQVIVGRCDVEDPFPVQVGPGHYSRCLLAKAGGETA
jgi:oligopeptide/dipeptide ABC transporter ATP-binding protein